jgi:hypothetical protein
MERDKVRSMLVTGLRKLRGKLESSLKKPSKKFHQWVDHGNFLEPRNSFSLEAVMFPDETKVNLGMAVMGDP